MEDGDADVAVFGRYFISNADLVKCLSLEASLNPYDSSTFYTPGPVGCIDQPFLEEDNE